MLEHLGVVDANGNETLEDVRLRSLDRRSFFRRGPREGRRVDERIEVLSITSRSFAP